MGGFYAANSGSGSCRPGSSDFVDRSLTFLEDSRRIPQKIACAQRQQSVEARKDAAIRPAAHSSPTVASATASASSEGVKPAISKPESKQARERTLVRSGRLDLDPTRLSRVHARFAGHITAIGPIQPFDPNHSVEMQPFECRRQSLERTGLGDHQQQRGG